MAPDLRTVFLIYAFINGASLIVVGSLWIMNHRRYKGIGYFVIDFLFQFFAILLVGLRGQIPDFISVILANFLSMSGAICGLFALEYYTAQKVSWRLNALLLGLFECFHIYYFYGQESLAIRNLIISISYSLIFSQIIWLLSRRIAFSQKQNTQFILGVFILYLVINLLRIGEFVIAEHSTNDYLHSGGFETFVIVAYLFLFVFLTYAIILMVSNRLMIEITTQEEKFSKVFHASPNAIMLTSMTDGRILEVNQGFEVLSGYSTQESIEKTSFALNLWEYEHERNEIVKELTEKGSVRNIETCFRRKDGSLFYGIISSDLIEVNGMRCILSTITDISEAKKMVEELRRNSHELQVLNATKDRFFSIIAHDLRSPFANIVSLSEILRDDLHDKDYAASEEYSNLILNSARKIMALLTNLLDWSRAQTGRIVFNPEYFSLEEVMEESLDVLRDVASHKGIEILVNCKHNSPAFLDKNMFSSILRNLVSNAIKFSPLEGKVWVGAEKTKTHLCLYVKDNGVGLKPEQIEKLFHIEESVSTPGTANEKGSGLGLLLCKDFVERHGGEIWVKSAPGQGSEFCFTLPQPN